jgi:hypothetical protein
LSIVFLLIRSVRRNQLRHFRFNVFCVSRLHRYFERDEEGINNMNEILKIAGLPVKARLETTKNWQIAQRQEGRHVWFSAKRRSRGEIWEIQQTFVREQFFSIETPDHAEEFFRSFGPFQRKENASDRTHIETANDVQFSALMKYKEWWTKFIETPSPECFTEWSGWGQFFAVQCLPSPSFTVEMGHVRKGATKYPSPYLRQYSYDVRAAVHSSIYIDKMAGLRGAICESCPKVFLSNTDKPRRFCSKKCADRARQKDWRNRNKKPASSVNGGNHGNA